MAFTGELLDALRFALPTFMSWSLIYSRFSENCRLCPENSSLGLPFLSLGEQVEKIQCTVLALLLAPKWAAQ